LGCYIINDTTSKCEINNSHTLLHHNHIWHIMKTNVG
jgi:hypothetical protein